MEASCGSGKVCFGEGKLASRASQETVHQNFGPGLVPSLFTACRSWILRVARFLVLNRVFCSILELAPRTLQHFGAGAFHFAWWLHNCGAGTFYFA